MRHSGFRGWKVLGGLAAAALLSLGCGRLPETGGERAGDPPEDFFGGRVGEPTAEDIARYQYSADRGYNRTIAELGSSIDPRTPEKEGTRGRSRRTEVWQEQQQAGTGGAGQGQQGAPSVGTGGKGFQDGIGAPGYSTPREPVPTDQFYSEPAPGKEEPGGADMPGEMETPGVGSGDH